jgi:parallel beta-helix repeat protein
MIPADKTSLLQIFNAKKDGTSYLADNGDFKLKFDITKTINCERISFYNSNISFQYLNLCGAMSFYNCNVSILNSHVIRIANDDLDLIIAGQITFLIMSDCEIDSKDLNGVLIKNQSSCSISNSEIIHSKDGIFIQDNSKGHFNNCKITHSVAKSNSILAQSSSSAKVFNCSFSRTEFPSVVSKGNSNLHLYNSKFHEIQSHYIYIKEKSQAKIQHCSADNIQTNGNIFYFEQCKAEVYDCNFSKIFGQSPIYSTNSELIVGRCSFNEGNSSTIFLDDHSKGDIFSCQFKNIKNTSILVKKHSQANISDVLIEKCCRGKNTSFK